MSNPPPSDDQPARGPTQARFSELLNYLFATTLKTLPDGRRKRYTLREVADATGISIGFLSEARHGAKENPPKEFIQLLADFFGVSPGFFFGPLPTDGGTPEAPETFAPSLRQIMLRASAYSEVERELLLEWMDSVDRAIGRAVRSQHTDDDHPAPRRR